VSEWESAHVCLCVLAHTRAALAGGFDGRVGSTGQCVLAANAKHYAPHLWLPHPLLAGD
jgi:hypothetical protein